MSLREQAAADLEAIVEDDTGGFGWPITVTDPAGASAALIGLSTDIGTTIDPDTGQAVAGRRASIALRIASLAAAGLGVPVGIADAATSPWLVTFDDIDGTSYDYRVLESMPDRAIGVVTCLLDAWQATP